MMVRISHLMRFQMSPTNSVAEVVPEDIPLPDLKDVTGFGLDWMAKNFYFTDAWKKTLTVCNKGWLQLGDVDLYFAL